MESSNPNRSLPARLAILAYGGLVYAFFLLTFLRLIGFLEGFVVARTVDVGPTAPLARALLVNLGILALFALQHTHMARHGFKRRFAAVLPEAIERASFVLATSLVLTLLVTRWIPLPGELWRVDGALGQAFFAVSWGGFGLVLLASFLIDHFDLFGLRQVVLAFRNRPYTEPRFTERLIYRYTRHPLYLGMLLAFWAAPVMSQGRLLFALVCTLYFVVVGVRLEERDLIRVYGERYREYRQRVPMLLPWPRRKAKRAPTGA